MLFLYSPETPTICNHFRAVELFQLSLKQKNQYVGRRECERHSKAQFLAIIYFPHPKCENKIDLLGIYSRRASGRFDLLTTDSTPYIYRKN